ncbi:unnamed protein product [Gadus morhua 'NCC']
MLPLLSHAGEGEDLDGSATALAAWPEGGGCLDTVLTSLLDKWQATDHPSMNRALPDQSQLLECPWAKAGWLCAPAAGSAHGAPEKGTIVHSEGSVCESEVRAGRGRTAAGTTQSQSSGEPGPRVTISSETGPTGPGKGGGEMLCGAFHLPGSPEATFNLRAQTVCRSDGVIQCSSSLYSALKVMMMMMMNDHNNPHMDVCTIANSSASGLEPACTWPDTAVLPEPGPTKTPDRAEVLEMEEPGAVNPSTLRVQLVTQVWFGLERTLQLDSMERLTGPQRCGWNVKQVRHNCFASAAVGVENRPRVPFCSPS